jgi:uncharacterized oxidoreductase
MATVRLVQPQALQRFVVQVLQAMGADQEVAAEVARHLVTANLSGHDSHGVLRLPQYVASADNGEIVPSARPEILRQTAVTALVDARRSFGHFSTCYALNWAMERAREHGLAAAAVRHSSHIGRLGDYAERAAEQGLIGIVTVGMAGPGVAPVAPLGGTRRGLGANPWSFGIPADGRPTMLVDISTSTVAEGKLRVARAKGVPVPPGCLIDREGRPSTDPNDYYAGGALLPFGGEVAAHKGFGLAIASALLGALAMIDDPDPTLAGSVQEGTTESRGRVAGVFLLVVNPAPFGDGQRYQTLVAEALETLKQTPRAPGVDEILIPGEPEVRTREQRSREGIPLPEAIWQELAAVAQRYGVPMPEHQEG